MKFIKNLIITIRELLKVDSSIKEIESTKLPALVQKPKRKYVRKKKDD